MAKAFTPDTPEELLTIIADRCCEFAHARAMQMDCRDYWGGNPEEWCVVCCSRELTDGPLETVLPSRTPEAPDAD